MSAGLLCRAAALLRDPYLCNWDRTVALALADTLETAEALADRVDNDVFAELEALSRAILREPAEQAEQPEPGVQGGWSEAKMAGLAALHRLAAKQPEPAPVVDITPDPRLHAHEIGGPYRDCRDCAAKADAERGER